MKTCVQPHLDKSFWTVYYSNHITFRYQGEESLNQEISLRALMTTTKKLYENKCFKKFPSDLQIEMKSKQLMDFSRPSSQAVEKRNVTHKWTLIANTRKLLCWLVGLTKNVRVNSPKMNICEKYRDSMQEKKSRFGINRTMQTQKYSQDEYNIPKLIWRNRTHSVN